MTEAYEIVEHSYDVVIVGAGGAGLRAALGMGRGAGDQVSNVIEQVSSRAGRALEKIEIVIRSWLALLRKFLRSREAEHG